MWRNQSAVAKTKSNKLKLQLFPPLSHVLHHRIKKRSALIYLNSVALTFEARSRNIIQA